ECDEVAPSHAKIARRGQSLPKGSIVRHSKIGPPMTAMGHERPRGSKPRDDACPLRPESGQVAPFSSVPGSVTNGTSAALGDKEAYAVETSDSVISNRCTLQRRHLH